MKSSRDTVLKNIQQALRRHSPVADFDEAFAQLTHQSEPPVQPSLNRDLVSDFSQAATASAAEIHDIGSFDALPQWIMQRCAQLSLQPSLQPSQQPRQQPRQQPPLALSPAMADLAVHLPSCHITEQVDAHAWGIVTAYAGIAETGTVVSVSEDCPSGLLFLVERLVVVLDKADIVSHQEDVWDKLRQRFNGDLPRAVNLVTGPSRTADVEQVIQLGAHGPRWVDYVLFED